MTPDEKQAYLRRVLPEIARACGFKTVDVHEDGSVTVSQDGCYFYSFKPATDDRDSAYMRRVLEIDIVWFRSEKYVSAFFCGWGDPSRKYHDDTPDSMGEAERWSALQAAAKKLGLE